MIKNVSVYANDKTVYFQKGNNYLMSITGEDLNELQDQLSKAIKGEEVDAAYVNYLRLNGLLENDGASDISNNLRSEMGLTNINERMMSSSNKIDLKVVVVSILEESSIEPLLNKLNSDDVSISITSVVSTCNMLKEVNPESFDLCLVIGSVLMNEKELIKCSTFLYKNNINQLCMSSEMAGFSIGPLICPSQNTASLESYILRRKVNSNDYKNFSDFSNADLTPLQKENGALDVWNDCMINVLREELKNFLQTCNSKLLGNLVLFDFEEYDMATSRVLRVPYLEVYSKSNPVNPFV